MTKELFAYINRYSKLKYIVLLLSVFMMGCSTYSVTQFPSKREYIDMVNKSIKENKINIYLKNDSLITAREGREIRNDTLYLSDISIPLKQVNKINIKSYPISSCLWGSGAGNCFGIYIRSNT